MVTLGKLERADMLYLEQLLTCTQINGIYSRKVRMRFYPCRLGVYRHVADSSVIFPLFQRNFCVGILEWSSERNPGNPKRERSFSGSSGSQPPHRHLLLCALQLDSSYHSLWTSSQRVFSSETEDRRGSASQRVFSSESEDRRGSAK